MIFKNLGLWQVDISAKQADGTGVTVILHWWLTVENIPYYLQFYHNIIKNINVTVVPQHSESIQAHAVNVTERINSSVQFNVFYDTLYNVTLAELLCDQTNVISLMELYFNKSK